MGEELQLMEERVSLEQEELIHRQIEELKFSNAALLTENDVFERFIGRTDPRGLLPQAGGAAGAPQLEGEGPERMPRCQPHIPTLHQLTAAQKLHVARREVTEMKQDREKLQDDHKASLREAETRLAQTRKAKKEFERRLLKPAKDGGLKAKEPEKLLQVVEDKSELAQFEKVNMKNEALRAREKKLQQQLLRKREAGRAEYEEFLQQDGERTTEKDLDDLQGNNLKVQHVLSSHKERLERETLKATQLSRDISSRTQMLAKIEKEIRRVEGERLKAAALNQQLRRQMTDYQAPTITAYMQVKDRHKQLQQSVHTWERRVGIAQVVLRTKARSPQRAAVTSARSEAEAGVRSAGHRIPAQLPFILEHRPGEAQ